MTMKTAAYCRYSSDNQRTASLDDQLRNIVTYCQRMGWPEPLVFQDAATSGALLSRPGLERLLRAASECAFDALLVDDLSRLGRDMAETPRIVKQLKYIGVRVIGVSDGVDTDREGYKADIGLRGIIGEMYLDDLAKKTHRGLTGQALIGKSAGGLSYGYRSVPVEDGFKREIEPEQADIVRWIFQQYANGYAPRTIAAQLNERGVPSPRGGTWAASAIYGDTKRGIGILSNRMYAGDYIWNRSQWLKDPATGKRKRVERPKSEWIVHHVPELRIVPETLWQAVKNRQKAQQRATRKAQSNNPRARTGAGPKYIFSGLITCGECGGKYTIVDHYRYGCSQHKERGASACGNDAKVARATVEQKLLAGIKTELLNDRHFKAFEKQVRELLKQGAPDIDAVRRRIRQAQKEADNIMAAIRAGILTKTTKSELEKAEQKIDEAKTELKQIENWQPAQILPRAREVYKGMVEKLENIEDVNAAREAIRGIFGEITLQPENGGLVALLGDGLEAVKSELNVVAGVRYETKLTTVKKWRIPLT